MSQRKMRPAFYALHAATLNPATTPDQLAHLLRAADAVPDRHRLSEGAVYASACRRWLLDTGTDWKASQQTDADTVWGQSDHRLRFFGRDWRCSCGDKGTSSDPEAAHARHIERSQPSAHFADFAPVPVTTKETQ